MLLTATQQSIAESVRAFAEERIRPRAHEFERAGAYPNELFRELAELGMMGMVAPESYGGAALDYVSYALALIEIAAADGALDDPVYPE